MEIYTIRDIAKKAGVGVSTVSRVLNNHSDVSEQTRKRVMEVVEACGFVQNRNATNLKNTKPSFGAIIVRGRRNMFLSDVAEQMLQCAQAYKTPFIIKYIDELDDEFAAMRMLHAERRAAGFILLGANPDASRAAASLGVPMVFATVDASAFGFERASSVCIDDRAAARAMMDRLLALGHRRVAIFGGSHEGGDVFARRYQGAMDSLTAHGLAFRPADYVRTLFSLEGAYESAKRFFTRNRDVTAVMAMSDTVAAGVIRALRDLGLRVPQDVSVTGYDGTEMARYYIPSIETVCQPTAQIARESVRLLCSMLDGGACRHVTADYSLIAGESVGPCPAARAQEEKQTEQDQC